MKAIPVSHSAFTIGTPSFQLKQEDFVGLEPKKNKRFDFWIFSTFRIIERF
jgi:hypothetical protein